MRLGVLVAVLSLLCPAARGALDVDQAMRLAVLVEFNALAQCRAPRHWVQQLSTRVTGFADALERLRFRGDVASGPETWTLAARLCTRTSSRDDGTVGVPGVGLIRRAEAALAGLSPAQAADAVQGFAETRGCTIDTRDANRLHDGFAAYMGRRLENDPAGAVAAGARRTLQLRVVLWAGWAALAPRLELDAVSGQVRLAGCRS